MTPHEASEIVIGVLVLIGLFGMGRWTCRRLDEASWSRRCIRNGRESRS